MHRLLFLLATAATLAFASGSATAAPERTLRTAFLIAESMFDPAQISDLYSRSVAESLFDSPLEWEFLSETPRMRPNTTDGMPEVADNFRRFTFRLKPGIYFADDPVFKGKARELTAEDYIYAIKRHYDPRWKSPSLYALENAKILGMDVLRKKAVEGKQPFDYDTPAEGLRALDRYTFEIRIAEPEPRFLQFFTDGSVMGAVAREVVEAYGDNIGAHPVGTGPFVLKEWKRSSRIVLTRNPRYRDVRFDEHPPAGNTRLVQFAQSAKGQRLPLVDRVEISIIEEPQPRWLAFLNGEQDVLEQLPFDFAENVIPNNRLAPHLAKRGMVMVRYLRSDLSMSYFGMENPVVGGYEPHKVALRRAISMAVDLDREIRVVRRGQAIPAQSVLPPGVFGYDPALKSTMSDYSVPRAKALLDLHGYVDRNGDGWREQPDGSALTLRYATQPDRQSRQLIEQWQRNMKAIGLKMEFDTAKWPENLKASRAGKLMMWGVGWSGGPDGDGFLALGYAPNKGGANHARFSLPAFDKLYEQQRTMPDSPERAKVMAEAARLLVTYMPYKVHVHRYFTDIAQPWVIGYHRNQLVRGFWKYVDVDPAATPAARAAH